MTEEYDHTVDGFRFALYCFLSGRTGVREMGVDRNEYREMLKSKSLEEIFAEELCPAYDWDDRDVMYDCIVELARRFDVPLQKWMGEEDEE